MCLPESDVELVGTETLAGVEILTTLLPIIARNIHNKYNIFHPMGRGLCAFNMYFVLYEAWWYANVVWVGMNESFAKFSSYVFNRFETLQILICYLFYLCLDNGLSESSFGDR